MTTKEARTHTRRIYPLDSRALTQEQIAVTFAMTSRRPEPFDEISQMVTEAKAQDFHERWVLNYGHSSVAEHAVIHMAVENISRLACDDLEDNRLAAYTEKSSRYQVLDAGSYYTPPELAGSPLEKAYAEACDSLFRAYRDMLPAVTAYLQAQNPRKPEERESGYNLRLRRIATDHLRFVLPAATLTNVGMTINSRSLEHAITKLLSAELQEERELGQELKEQGKRITPTLIKYADRNEYLVLTRQAQRATQTSLAGAPTKAYAKLVRYDADAERRVAAALLYRYSNATYEEVWRKVEDMSPTELEGKLDAALEKLGPHDVPVRELENTDYTFEFLLDYGAYRELKRHRMMSFIPQPLTVKHGYTVPDLVLEAGLLREFERAMEFSATGPA